MFENFFDETESNSVWYIDRPDAIGGQIYIRLRRHHGKIIMSIGGDDGENEIKFVENKEEVEKIFFMLR